MFGVDAGEREQLLGAGTADAVDVGECDLDALVAREVDTNKACHVVWRFPFGLFQRCLVVSRPASALVVRAPASGPEVVRPVVLTG